MTELVERVARRLFSNGGKYPDLQWDGEENSEARREAYRSEARAAIAEVLDWLADEDRKLAPWFSHSEMQGLARILRKEALDQ